MSKNFGRNGAIGILNVLHNYIFDLLFIFPQSSLTVRLGSNSLILLRMFLVGAVVRYPRTQLAGVECPLPVTKAFTFFHFFYIY